MSNTPRTDEAENAHYAEGDYFGEDTTKEAYQFARQLERELDLERKRLNYALDMLGELTNYVIVMRSDVDAELAK